MSTKFVPLEVKRFPQPKKHETAESRYWKNYKTPSITKHHAKITDLDFCSVSPFDLAVTSSTRVHLFDSTSLQEKKTLSRFKDVAYSGTFRKDGKLLVAGTQNCLVNVFDLTTRHILRTFTGHKSAVKVTGWEEVAGGGVATTLFSASDDCTVRRWDILTQNQLSLLEGHTDHVRACLANPYSPSTLVSGSYDHTIKLWDSRLSSSSSSDSSSSTTNDKQAEVKLSKACVMQINHGAPIEDLLLLPGGGLLISAGENVVKVWDLISGGKLVHSFSNHQKTVTSLCTDHACTRLFSASLDCSIKIYDIQTYSVTHSMMFKSPILSVAVSPDQDCSVLAVGMADGSLALRQHSRYGTDVLSKRSMKKRRRDDEEAGEDEEDDEEEEVDSKSDKPRPPKPGTKRFFMRGANTKASEEDYVVAVEQKQKLRSYDIFLKKFQYQHALDAALATKRPDVIITVLDELLQRGGLKIALGNRTEMGVVPIMDFVVKYVTVPKYSHLLIDVANMILDIYTSMLGSSQLLDEKVMALRSKLAEETSAQKAMLKTQGALDLLLSIAGTPSSLMAANNNSSTPLPVTPSSNTAAASAAR